MTRYSHRIISTMVSKRSLKNHCPHYRLCYGINLVKTQLKVHLNLTYISNLRGYNTNYM